MLRQSAFADGDRLLKAANVLHQQEALNSDTPEQDKSWRPQQVLEAEARLQAVLEVNRKLHAQLAEKKKALQSSRDTAATLQRRLEGWAVEDLARRAKIEELQEQTGHASVESPSRASRDAREAALLARDATKLETKIAALNAENLALSAQHKEDRTKAAEKAQRLQAVGTRERDLAKHLTLVAGELTQASRDLCAETGGSPTDFAHLPGLRVQKLIGSLSCEAEGQTGSPRPATGEPN